MANDSCIRLLEQSDAGDGLTNSPSWWLLGALVGMTFLLQVFDIYIDFRQMRSYRIPTFPLNFLAAFNLYEQIESKHKESFESETASPKVDDAHTKKAIPQDGQEAITAEPNQQPADDSSKTDEAGRPTEPQVSKKTDPNKITPLDERSAHQKALESFQNGQDYNYESTYISVCYKAIKAVFWIAFWCSLAPMHLMQLNIGWLLPEGAEDCGSWSYFWLDLVLALMFIAELSVLYFLFFSILMSVKIFYVQERYGFRKMTLKNFLIRKAVVEPVLQTLMTFLYTLITMAIFHYIPLVIPIYVFIILLVLITATIVVSEILFNSQMSSLSKGKMTPLKDSNEQLHNAVESFKFEVIQGQSKPEFDSFVLDGQSGHSNCHVTGMPICGQKRKLVVYDQMFKHIRLTEHLMAIVRHEVGHVVQNHVVKLTISRVVYYCTLFVVVSVFIFTKETWLAKFGLPYDSLFMALFIVMHFFHFKFCYYLYEVFERYMQRGFEYSADKYSVKTGGAKGCEEIIKALLLVFYANKADFYTDTLYSKIKNHHPTLNERIDRLEDMIADQKLKSGSKSVIMQLTKNGPKRLKEVKVNSAYQQSDSDGPEKKKDDAAHEFHDDQTEVVVESVTDKTKRTKLNHQASEQLIAAINNKDRDSSYNRRTSFLSPEKF